MAAMVDTFMDWKTKFSFKEAHAGGGPVGFVTSFTKLSFKVAHAGGGSVGFVTSFVSFKEAHAGGGPVGFVPSCVDTLMVLTGSPAGSGWEAALAISAGGGAFSYKDRDAEGKGYA
ncbi:hypothetical protein T484DRAFT_1778206 [Baffinella frigidus]|nr:hypothetical protein T484DRAFT_1778206 [Cryptophyta sp. CCMP2293]